MQHCLFDHLLNTEIVIRINFQGKILFDQNLINNLEFSR